MLKHEANQSVDEASVTTVPHFTELEQDVLRFWDNHTIFKQALEKTKNGKPFVFYEGPPTANGKPGIHHVLARVFKDVIVRFQTMRGHFVARKAGWDTHGLPVELQIEKQLKISGKKQIENIVKNDRYASIAEFNARCKASVTSYIHHWESLTRRIGFWLDMDNAYRTYSNEYIETLWWIIKQMSHVSTKQGPLLFKGHKVIQHCPRCETALSSHEVAQGYKTVTEASVYIRFAVQKATIDEIQKLIDAKKSVFILSWTTTPWTLPGNVGLAINPKLKYALLKHEDEYLICASDRVKQVVGEDVELIKAFQGKELVGTVYTPLFEGAVERAGSSNAWSVLSADFVTAVDGTGVVHTAVMYGEDDYQLGLKAGLPRQHTVDQTGHFFPRVKPFAGLFVKDPQTEKAITDDLHKRKLLFKVEPYTHEYPFCWRCGTPLLYYAKDSWFVRMSALRSELQYNNKHINWTPSHIKDGRFGEWLREVKDWAFSRERYWGTPLPIWVCSTCGKTEMIGSFAELSKRAIKRTLPQAERTVYLMRHGIAQSNAAEVISTLKEKDTYHLTDEGREQVEKQAKKLKGKIDIIITSDFIRTTETAKILSEITGAPFLEDQRLRESFKPSFEGKPVKEYFSRYPDARSRWFDAPDGGETLFAMSKRVQECIVDSLQRFSGKRLIFVSHGDPLGAFLWMMTGENIKNMKDLPPVKKGEASKFVYKHVPINPHRPYIDDIHLQCSCSPKAVMKRVEEVADVWFDSGSMPFAQEAYPFAQGEAIANYPFPADYISEAIDQTRGWFYTLLAVSTLLGKGTPYKNVICLGHILDDKGEKMSKSKGNIVDPWDVINETGADALRLYLVTLNQPGDSKLFSLDGVKEVLRKTLMILWNVQSFYLLYTKPGIPPLPKTTSHILDAWLLAELNEAGAAVTEHLKRYRVFEAARRLREFVTDLSTWYLRRSRNRLKADRNAQRVLGYAIWKTSVLFAPFTPLFAEIIYRRMISKKDVSSVHLESWPDFKQTGDMPLREAMKIARMAVEAIHSIRKEHAIKSRQPLAEAWIQNKIPDELASVIADEVNVDTVQSTAKRPEGSAWVFAEKAGMQFGLNIEMTDSLRERGKLRELLRQVNDLRKLARLQPQDRIALYIQCDANRESILKPFIEGIQTDAKILDFSFELPETIEVKRTIKFDGIPLTLALRKVK